jgi:hypothetical protein
MYPQKHKIFLKNEFSNNNKIPPGKDTQQKNKKLHKIRLNNGQQVN